MHLPTHPAMMRILSPAFQIKKLRFREGNCFAPGYNKEVTQPQIPCTAHHCVLVVAPSTLVQFSFSHFKIRNNQLLRLFKLDLLLSEISPPVTIKDFDLMPTTHPQYGTLQPLILCSKLFSSFLPFCIPLPWFRDGLLELSKGLSWPLPLPHLPLIYSLSTVDCLAFWITVLSDVRKL